MWNTRLAGWRHAATPRHPVVRSLRGWDSGRWRREMSRATPPRRNLLIDTDSLGRTSGMTWTLKTMVVSDVVVLSPAGRVIDQTVDGTDVWSGPNFKYDGAGRLVESHTKGDYFK